MVDYETLDAKEFKYGRNNFIEVARKKVEENEFISLSKGYYTLEGEKRYKGGIGFPDEKELKEFLVNAIQEI